MKLSRLIVLGIAAASALAAAKLANIDRRIVAPTPPPPALVTVEVLIAKSNLDPGHIVAEHDVAWQSWPEASSGPSLVTKSSRPEAIKDFVGGMVRTPISAGEPIRDSKVVRKGSGGFMAAALPHGMRAMSLDIAPDTDAGGFILPNDRVDVVWTRSDSNKQNFSSDVILSSIRVLAVDQTIAEKDGEKVIIGKTATVEVDPRQAKILANARQVGTISLVLRSLVDSQLTADESEDTDDGAVNVVRFGMSVRKK